MEPKFFDLTYCGHYNEKNKLTDHTTKFTATNRKYNRKSFPYEITSTELKENNYTADNYKGIRQNVKMTYMTSAKFVWKIAPSPQNDPMERLKKFQRTEKKYNQRGQKPNSVHVKRSRPTPPEVPQFVDVEMMEPIFPSVDSLNDHSKSYSEKWNLNTERAYELKNLLEERERYFNGEMDELYYKAGPDRLIMPTPTNLRVLTGRSTLSSRQDTSIHAIKNSDDSLDLFSESFDFSFFLEKQD